MGQNIKANFAITILKAMEPSKEKIIFMKENGKMVKCMEQVKVNGKMRKEKQQLGIQDNINKV